ncbi:MAG: hypothetical protein COB67_07510 [SAR324 cluster bacterium]|uniref:Uncharacterized protein n=1 Tax=SAR324 cluster bacterium TaxID=2024889 RepID=A0A2A4T2Z6_9DELT|nr:MAG: hypothetical protein COB67_07510 [SAR324 cluster bacterium]
MEANGTKISISRTDFLDSFVQLYRAIKDYDELLVMFADEDKLEPEKVRALILKRMNNLELGAVNVRSMELIGAYIRFSLEKFKGEKLHFMLPDEPGDDFFAINDAYLQLSKNIEEVEQELHEIEEKIYYLVRLLPPQQMDKIRLLIKAIASFFKAIIRKDQGDMGSAINYIHHLTASKESYFLINDVGLMVRGIYNSLQDFSDHVPTEELGSAVRDEMPDAIDKLNLVIHRMEEAANSTLDDVENLLESSSEEQQKNQQVLQECASIQKQLESLKGENPQLAASIDPMLVGLQSKVIGVLEQRSERMREDEGVYFRIIGSQSFQDLTGQTLKKIISFIEELELKLLGILKKYSGTMGVPVETETTEPEHLSPLIGKTEDGLVLEGPQDNRESAEQGVKQADIDNMLAEFGF